MQRNDGDDDDELHLPPLLQVLTLTTGVSERERKKENRGGVGNDGGLQAVL